MTTAQHPGEESWIFASWQLEAALSYILVMFRVSRPESLTTFPMSAGERWLPHSLAKGLQMTCDFMF